MREWAGEEPASNDLREQYINHLQCALNNSEYRLQRKEAECEEWVRRYFELANERKRRGRLTNIE